MKTKNMKRIQIIQYLYVSSNASHTAPPFNFFRMRRTGSRDFVGQAIHIGLLLAASLSWKSGQPTMAWCSN